MMGHGAQIYDDPLPIGNEIVYWHTVDDQFGFERWSLHVWKGLLVAKSSDFRYHVFETFNGLLPKLSTDRYCIVSRSDDIPVHVQTLADVFRCVSCKIDSLPPGLREQLVTVLVAQELSNVSKS